MSNFETFILKGILKFPQLTAPFSYDGEKKEFKEDWKNGEYSTVIELTIGEDYTEKQKDFLLKKIEEHKEILKKQKAYPPTYRHSIKGKTEIKPLELIPNLPFKEGFRKNEDDSLEPTNNIEIKLKRNAVNKQGKPALIQFFSAQRQLLSAEEMEQISSGSFVRVIFSINPWDLKKQDDRTKEEYVSLGLTLTLLQVQVIKAVRKSGACMFDEEYDSYIDAEEEPLDEAEEIYNNLNQAGESGQTSLGINPTGTEVA